MPKAVQVRIMGQKFTLRSDDEEEHIRKVADYVDGKMHEVSQSTHPGGKYNMAMLVALNIADEYHRLKDDYDEAANRVDRLLERLATTLSEDD